VSAFNSVLIQAFGRPSGILGRLGGAMMARMNQPYAAWVIGLLEIHGNDRVCEVGFGPGVGIQLLAQSANYVAGIDPSLEMLSQAAVRNAKALESGQVDLRIGTADRLPFENNTFDKVLSINSMQMWPDATAGIAEIWRVMKPGATIGLGFTAHSGQTRNRMVERLTVAGFVNARVVETEGPFCALAVKR